jgi:hypothetical protein
MPVKRKPLANDRSSGYSFFLPNRNHRLFSVRSPSLTSIPHAGRCEMEYAMRARGLFPRPAPDHRKSMAVFRKMTKGRVWGTRGRNFGIAKRIQEGFKLNQR